MYICKKKKNKNKKKKKKKKTKEKRNSPAGLQTRTWVLKTNFSWCAWAGGWRGTISSQLQSAQMILNHN